MKKLWGLTPRAIFSALAAVAILGSHSARSATLEWSANPEPDIAFYTVYVESASGTTTNEVHDGTQFSLDALLPNVPHTLFVTATSTSGLESDRSAGMPYLLTIGAPSTTTHPANTILPSGSLLSLSVTASGPSPLTYQWRKDGQALPGQTSATLNIPNASASNSGSYTVIVSNSGGSVTSSAAQVIIQDPPIIHTQPQSAGIPIGTEMLLSIGVNGSALRYQWFKGAQAIAGQTNSTLRIAAVTASDQANYRATVSNLVGTATSEVATITILYPPAIATAPASTNLAVGGAIQLAVTVNGTQPFTFQWLKDSQPIPDATSATFAILSATLNDSGAYAVRVSNSVGSVTSAAAQVNVLNAPSIVTQPASQDILDGSLLELTVAAQGSGTLSYQWMKNDVPIPGATAPIFRITAATISNSGTYKVAVSNTAGSIESAPATVRVLPRITILQQPASATLQLGAALNLSVQATGPDPLTYQWFRNAQPIPAETTPQLQIAQVSLTDAGSYTVTISSSLESVTSSAALLTILQEPPTIVTQPVSKDVLDGSPLELTVVAEGTGTLSYQWLKNDVTIPGATAPLFQIAAATSANAGAYKVRVSSDGGSTESATATVRVLPGITILQQPASTNLQLGAALSLFVQATGPDPLTYQWFRNAQPIPAETTPQLQIAQVSFADAGNYTVAISSSLETVISAAAQVSIQQSPPVIVSQPQSAQVALDAQHLLTVTAQGTDLSYQWLKNDVAIPGSTAATLTLANFTSADQGNYRVTITNPFGSVTSDPAVLTLINPPVILTSPTSTNLAAGGTIQLFVEVSGTSPFAFEWFKDGTLLPARTNQSLVISSATTNHSGAYHVRVVNPSGAVTSSSATVLVLDPPRIITQPLSTNLLEGTRLALSVGAAGSPTLSYQWSFNGAPISGATNPSFEIAVVAPANAGSYTVRVSNSVGAITSSAATVQVSPAITIVEQPVSTNLPPGTQLRLNVQATGPSSLTYQWYRNGAKLGGKTSSELIIANTTTADSGTYTVEISSSIQKVLSAPAQVTISTPPSATDCALSMATAADGSLRITGVAPPNTTYELQRTDTLNPPNWRRIQNVSTRSDGRFEVTLSTTGINSVFIRTVRR